MCFIEMYLGLGYVHVMMVISYVICIFFQPGRRTENDLFPEVDSTWKVCEICLCS